jgi:hypothetical protein
MVLGLLISFTSFAQEDKWSLALGVGVLQNGFGAQVAYQSGNYRYHVSAGCSTYNSTQHWGGSCGPGLGFLHQGRGTLVFDNTLFGVHLKRETSGFYEVSLPLVGRIGHKKGLQVGIAPVFTYTSNHEYSETGVRFQLAYEF